MLKVQLDLPIYDLVVDGTSRADCKTQRDLGAVYTRAEVVERMLDEAGLTSDAPLHRMRVLEPSFGGGAFLMPYIDRLLACIARHRLPATYARLAPRICGVELHEATYDATRSAVVNRLQAFGISAKVASRVANAWLMRGDFMLVDIGGKHDAVVGNPPYLSYTNTPEDRRLLYRAVSTAYRGKCDLSVAFLDRMSSLLAKRGKLVALTPRVWRSTRYGAALRAKIRRDFHLRKIIDLKANDAFENNACVLPMIVCIDRAGQGPIDFIAQGACSPVQNRDRGRNGAPLSLTREPEGLEVVDALRYCLPSLGSIVHSVSRGLNFGRRNPLVFSAETIEPDQCIGVISGVNARQRSLVEDLVLLDTRGGSRALQARARAAFEQRQDEIARFFGERELACLPMPLDKHAKLDSLVLQLLSSRLHPFVNAQRRQPLTCTIVIRDDSKPKLELVCALLETSIAQLASRLRAKPLASNGYQISTDSTGAIPMPRLDKIDDGLAADLVQAASARDLDRLDELAARAYKLTPQQAAAIKRSLASP